MAHQARPAARRVDADTVDAVPRPRQGRETAAGPGRLRLRPPTLPGLCRMTRILHPRETAARPRAARTAVIRLRGLLGGRPDRQGLGPLRRCRRGAASPPPPSHACPPSAPVSLRASSPRPSRDDSELKFSPSYGKFSPSCGKFSPSCSKFSPSYSKLSPIYSLSKLSPSKYV